MSEKSILEQALLQVQTLEEAVKQNAKGILASTMKQELNELLKESQVEEEEKVDVKEQPDPEEEETDDMPDEVETDDEEVSDDESENDDDLDNEPEKGIDSTDSDDELDTDNQMGSDDEVLPSDDEELPSDDIGPAVDDDDVMDMTGATDDEVLKVFKAMKPEDGVVVKKDGDQLDVDMGDDEYIIKLDDDSSMDSEEAMEGMGQHEFSEGDTSVEEDTIYEISLDEDDDESEEKEPKEEKDVKEIEATEAARNKSNPHGNKGEAKRSGIPSKKTFKAGSGVFGINEEVENLKKQNAEYKKALVLFKDKLNEVAVFNASLAYATRLFTEHSTTKQEKLNILKRFDTISSMNEAKNLFNTIKNELDTKKPVTESVVEKISNTPQTSTSQEVLAESKAYENPQFKRMKDLMSKIK